MSSPASSLKNVAKRVVFALPFVRGPLERANFYRRIERSPHIRERKRAAWRYLRGEGIEIGALHIAQRVPRSAKVRYVDYMDEREARQFYPDLRYNRLAKVDIVDNGETLSSIAEHSLDFVIANHVLEHCQNPLATIENWLSKLRPNGIIFMAVPDMAHTFDHERQPIHWTHLMRDYKEGAQWSLPEHYEEYGRCVAHLEGQALADFVEEALRTNANIHFHAWRMDDLLPALLELGVTLAEGTEVPRAFTIEFAVATEAEFLVILRKV